MTNLSEQDIIEAFEILIASVDKTSKMSLEKQILNNRAVYESDHIQISYIYYRAGYIASVDKIKAGP